MHNTNDYFLIGLIEGSIEMDRLDGELNGLRSLISLFGDELSWASSFLSFENYRNGSGYFYLVSICSFGQLKLQKSHYHWPAF
jgi:hypothetical protein